MEFTARLGVPITDSFETSSFSFLATGLHEASSATRRYTAGPGILVRLPRGFAAEFDVLYKRLGFDLNTSSPAVPVLFEHTWTTANSWEFPILGVYRFRRAEGLRPRLAGGVAFRTVSGVSSTGECYAASSQYSQFCPAPAPIPQPGDSHLTDHSSFGGVVGVGIEQRLGPIRLVPEVRYTRWRMDANSTGPVFDLRSNPNQADFLLGIIF